MIPRSRGGEAVVPPPAGYACPSGRIDRQSLVRSKELYRCRRPDRYAANPDHPIARSPGSAWDRQAEGKKRVGSGYADRWSSCVSGIAGIGWSIISHHSFLAWPAIASFGQQSGPVGNYGQGFGFAVGADAGDQKFLGVGRHVVGVEAVRTRAHRKQRLDFTGNYGVARLGDLRGHEFIFGRDEKYFVTHWRPDRLLAAIRGNLPFADATAERDHVNFRVARFHRRKGQPFGVGRYAGMGEVVIGAHQRVGLLVAGARN